MQSTIQTVAIRFSLPEQVVANLMRDTPQLMRARYDLDCAIPSNGEYPETAYQRLEQHTVRILPQDDPLEAYIDYIDFVNPSDVIPSEPEEKIRRHPTFKRYVDWYRDGFLPPYPTVCEQYYGAERTLIGLNRRRILAAQDANISTLPVWLGRWNRETGLPLKYGEVLKAVTSLLGQQAPIAA